MFRVTFGTLGSWCPAALLARCHRGCRHLSSEFDFVFVPVDFMHRARYGFPSPTSSNLTEHCVSNILLTVCQHVHASVPIFD